MLQDVDDQRRRWSGAKNRGCNPRRTASEWQVNQAYNWNSIRTVAQIHGIRILLASFALYIHAW